MSRHESDLKRRERIYRAQLQEAVNAWPQFGAGNDEPVSGADLVDWFAVWHDNTKRLLKMYHRRGDDKWSV